MAALPKIKAKSRSAALTALLNQSLASAIDLKLQAKQAHWNVKGENFIALHELFDKASAEIDEYADMLAERTVQLGGIAQGTLQAVGKSSGLSPYPANIQDSQQHIKALGGGIGALAESLRQAIDTADAEGDAVTADLFTEITRGLDKLRWFVESHRQ